MHDPYDLNFKIDPADYVTDFWIDGNGVPTERLVIGGEPVFIHYDDLPEKPLVAAVPVSLRAQGDESVSEPLYRLTQYLHAGARRVRKGETVDAVFCDRGAKEGA